ncbi:pyridoxal-phosphate dependent enzyme [Acuticoccus yangtzensis]|uniref:pyridoxal-phosphate dependent enzyme n=1 Tax=Acuticoccus yangtzensis TaxID=1443441 RepID=UPI00094966DD|nr:pyridoxal-phosphate dependent enzyme [Acuticoccus yangtzensis]
MRATFVDEVVLVSDAEMLDAAQTLWREVGIAADLSGAASYAMLQTGGAGLALGTRVCALVCAAGSDGAGPAEMT